MNLGSTENQVSYYLGKTRETNSYEKARGKKLNFTPKLKKYLLAVAGALITVTNV